jgi:type I restriction enzyme M protein
VPFSYQGGIDEFMQQEVLPYAPDAVVNDAKTQVGYELSFTKYFYQPIQLRTLEEITADIRAVEQETDGLLDEILGGTL